jgi:hypothetical protein
MKPCGHTTAVLPKHPSDDYCRVCYLWAVDPKYRALWDNQGAGPPADLSKRTLPCLFLGPVIHQGHCKCPFENVHQCELHGAVTMGHCQTCNDYLSQ